MLCFLSAVCWTVLSAHAASYTFVAIDVPGATNTTAFVVNNHHDCGHLSREYDHGDLCGHRCQCPGGVYIDAAKVRHGYLRDSRGTFTAIDFPGSSQTEAFALNDAGAVVGAYMLNGVQHGFLLTGSPSPPVNFQTIDFPGNTGTRAIGINNAGQIVGDYVDANGVRHGFLATPVSEASPRQN
jgi:hypothetical protein